MIFACGEKPANKGSAAATEAEAAPETSSEEITTTEPPPTTTPEPTTTEEPTEPFVVDPSLPYWEQIQSELAFYGLKDGVKIFKGDDEADLMKKFTMNNGKKEALDLTEDNSVPFSAGYKVWTTKDMTNWWDANYSVAFAKDIPTQQDDLVVGVIWIKGKRVAESDAYAADDVAQYYLAIKTPTDNWASEGEMEPHGDQYPEEKWQKVIFAGRVVNEEAQSSTMSFNIYIGFGIQEFEIGGIYANLYPSTAENEKAILKLMW